MDRQIVYPGAIPLETDLLNTNRNALKSIGSLIADVLGTSTQFSGLACVPNTPAALNVIVQPGVAYALSNLDNTPYSSLLADTAHQIMKQGILEDSVTLNTPAPVTSGFSINYLISANFVEQDTGPVVLPYYNASNPQQAYSGPGGLGTSQNTQRTDTIQLTMTAGVAATSGTQVTPATPAGTTALYVVTVAFGQTTVIAANIAKASGAPFFSGLLNQSGGTMTGPLILTTATAPMQAVPLSQVAPIYSISALPTSNVGPIMVAEAGEVWLWSTSAYFTGYRSPLCGRPLDGHTVAPLASEVDAVGGNLSKTAYAALWGYANENSLVVTSANWVAGTHNFVDNGDNTFRAPDLRNMFRRYTGTDADTANARKLGSSQAAAFASHNHSLSPYFITNQTFSSGAAAAVIQSGTGSSTGAAGNAGGSETRPKNIAFAPRIHV